MTLPVAYAANVTMAALNGQEFSNVVFRKGNSTSETFLLSIAVDNSFPLPKNIEAKGNIIVAGAVMNPHEVIMISIAFTELNVTKGSFSISDISTVPVVLHKDLISGKNEVHVLYAESDINKASDTLLSVSMSGFQMNAEYKRYQNMENFNETNILEESTWIIKIKDRQTTVNFDDDQYIVSGAGLFTKSTQSGLDIVRVIVVNNAMNTTCKLNPQDGYVWIKNIDSDDGKVELGHVLLKGHSGCDGTMTVSAATGVYSRSWGQPIQLFLDK
jgi:hypothetical protein